MNENCYKYKGAIHIHSKHSDGTGTIRSIAKSAKKAGLDWIIITDHNYYDNNEGIIEGVYVIKAQEISPKMCNHYLAFGINETIKPCDNPHDYVDTVRKLGGIGFSAHPDEGIRVNNKGELYPRKNSHNCIPWTDKSIVPDGVEIWNWFSSWADNLDDSNIFTLAYAYLFKHNIVKDPSAITLRWWDKLNNEFDKIIPAIGGVDAHALKFYKYIIPVTVFPYETCFKTITNNIFLFAKLSDNFHEAKNQILNAIKNGNNIIYNNHIYKKLPEINVTNSKSTYYCGQEIELDDECFINYKADKNMDICLIYNGSILERFNSDNFKYKLTKSGKYRIEVYYKNKSFAYTNPFNIKDTI